MDEHHSGMPPVEKISFFSRMKAKVKEIYDDERNRWKHDYSKYFKLSLLILAGVVIVSYLFFSRRPDITAEVFSKLKDFLMRKFPRNASSFELFLIILWQNARASAIALSAGWIPFACLPLIFIGLNGANLGLIVLILHQNGYDVPLTILSGIAPHGIFEIAAWLYTMSVGLFFSITTGKQILARCRKKDKPNADFLESYPQNTKLESIGLGGQILRSYLRVIFPLLVIAAAVEAFVTPLLIKASIPR